MSQKFTLHTHTIGFDGRNSVEEMVKRAIEMGFDTIGFSNHFIVHPGIKNSKMYKYAVRDGYQNIYSSSFDEATERFKKHYEEIEKLRQLYPNINILRGMEVDYFNRSAWREGFHKAAEILKPDYTIGATHFIEYNGQILNSHDWKSLDGKTQRMLMLAYWQNIEMAADSRLFTFMAHLDLPKKVGLGMDARYEDDEDIATDAISMSKTAVEINTSFYDRSADKEPYPSNRILNMIKNKDIPVLISDDAHSVDKIGRYFDKAQKIITDMNLKQYTR